MGVMVHKMGECGQRVDVQSFSYKISKPGGVMYSVVTAVNNTVWYI